MVGFTLLVGQMLAHKVMKVAQLPRMQRERHRKSV
jgi:hypothetical protein